MGPPFVCSPHPTENWPTSLRRREGLTAAVPGRRERRRRRWWWEIETGPADAES